MFVYGVCVGPSGKFEAACGPSLERYGFEPVILRRHQRSIFEAYVSMMDEASDRWPDLEGLVLLHDDVVIEDDCIETNLRRLFRSGRTGIVGVVGGTGHDELSWWKTDERFGHCRMATHVDEYSRGDHEVSTVDGLFMALSPPAVQLLSRSLRQGGYPAWHGYDSEMCRLVRQAGLSVLVSDFELFHDCKRGPWGRAEYGQAIMEWWLRSSEGGIRQRVAWKMKRHLLATAARLGR